MTQRTELSTLKSFRERFATFLLQEEAGREDVLTNEKFNTHRVNVGQVTLTTRLGLKTIDIDMHAEKSYHSACVCVTKGGDHFISVTPRWLESPDFPALIAHELGHLVSGHLDKSSWGIMSPLDCNVRKSKYYYDYLTSLDTEESSYVNQERAWAKALVDYAKRERDYMRSVFFGLIRGGVVALELEADLAGAKYVGSDAMAKVHLENLMQLSGASKGRIGVESELVNRVGRLSGLGIHPTLSFELDMYV